MEEKKAADETSEAMLEMLREMVNRIKNEIQGERKERYFIYMLLYIYYLLERLARILY